MKDFSRLDALQAVTYTVKVAVLKKWQVGRVEIGDFRQIAGYMGRLKMRDMKIRDGQKCRGGKCET